MAASCNHPDARWLNEACTGKNVKSFGDAKRVFSTLDQKDARVLCFMWLCGGHLTSVRHSAELGYAFAQALFAAWEIRGVEKFKLAQLSAAQGERDGYAMLGWCFLHGEGCEKNLVKAKENFLIASELGDVSSMTRLGELLNNSDPQRWRWWGKAATFGRMSSFLFNFETEVKSFNSGSGSASVMFAIGQALHGHVNDDAKTIFNSAALFDSRIYSAKQAIAFHLAQIETTKDAMRAWTQVGIRWNVVKDIRKLIAKLIWDSLSDI